MTTRPEAVRLSPLSTKTSTTSVLLTRRLLERGIRYVQVFDSDIAPWDDDNNLNKHHAELAKASEFGRTATAEHDFHGKVVKAVVT